MFAIGDKVRVVSDDFGGPDLVGKEGTVVTVDKTQAGYSIVVLLENFDPLPIDVLMAQTMGYPVGSVPFGTRELEAI